MTIYLIPLEPLKERYTESWYNNIPYHFERSFNTVIIDGEQKSDFVDVGTFLDLNSSAFYKSEQLKQIANLFFNKQVKDGDGFFVYDIQFPGIETIRLLAHLQNINIKLYGFCHASSYTHEDFMSKAEDYLQFFELGWFTIFDKIFVGSEYHKNAIIDRRLSIIDDKEATTEIANKIIVTGNPLFECDYVPLMNNLPEKKQRLIISNRFDWEKRPNLSLDFCYILKHRFPDIEIVLTTSRPTFKSNKKWLVELARCMEADGILKIYEDLSKKEYHKLLAESKVFLTNTIEENFGYCLIEAILFNVYPLAENNYSHPELLNHNEMFLFNDTDEIIDKLTNLMNTEGDISFLAKKYFSSIGNIVEMYK